VFWACAQLKPQQERLALHFLGLAGFETYLPRLRDHRVRGGRRVETSPPLFPGYAFVVVQLQWVDACYAPGVVRLVLDGERPARVPDRIIEDLRKRERNGLIELPRARGLRAGDRLRVLRGPFAGHLALYAGQAPHERVAVLLALLGGQRRVTLPKGDLEAAVTGFGTPSGHT
jgi:transcriptional antiterminator RfaH